MKALTEETPGKVMSLLTAALASLAFLFMVSATNADFTGTKTAVADPFNSENLVATIDSVSNGYSRFLATNVFEPTKADFALAADNLSWLKQNASDGLVAMLGLDQSGGSSSPAVQLSGRVAGAVTTQPYEDAYHSVSHGAIGLFSLLGIQ